MILRTGMTWPCASMTAGRLWKGRIIDLSYAAAQAMGMNGICALRLEILGLGTSSEPAVFGVQVGAFKTPATPSV